MSGGGAAPAPEPKNEVSQGYWALVWGQMKKNIPGMVGLVVAGGLLVVALFAPLIANDKPIACSYKGNVSFPAVVTYVDTWVPWKTLQYRLKSMQVGEMRPFGDHAGQTRRPRRSPARRNTHARSMPVPLWGKILKLRRAAIPGVERGGAR